VRSSYNDKKVRKWPASSERKSREPVEVRVEVKLGKQEICSDENKVVGHHCVLEPQRLLLSKLLFLYAITTYGYQADAGVEAAYT
jgi:hypothetical protein